MNIFQVKTGKKRWLSLLLLADEQEDMIDRYLERGTMYALEDGGEVRAVCVITDEGNGTAELKNLAVEPQSQRRGYGRNMVEFAARTCRGSYDRLLVGTGDSPLTLPFYERCGFVLSHIVPNFFIEHYDHPIFEAGRQLINMIYLSMEL